MESSKEIEKLFYQDSFYKKKIGSNVYRRTGKGSEKARVSGGVRFAKNNFKRYEKNSRVVSENIFTDIIPINEFETYNDELQKEMLIEWMTRYSKEKIKREMNIGYKRLDTLLKQFNVEVGKEIMRATDKEMQEFKEDTIDKTRFKLLPDCQKYEIVNYWQEERGMLNKEMASRLGYKLNTFNTKKSQWKEEFEENKGENNMSKDLHLLEGLDEVKYPLPEEMDGSSVSPVVKEHAPINNNKVIKKVSGNKVYNEDIIGGLKLQFEGIYTVDNLNEKHEAMLALMDDKKRYKVKVSIVEHEEG